MAQDELNYVTNIERTVSAARLSVYRRPTDVGDLDAIARYLWNVALSEALYPALQTLEITLRNSLCDAITSHFIDPLWFDRQPPVLHQSELDKVAAAKRELLREKKPLEAGRIVAELNFGFWTSLLDRRYERILWPRFLKQVFPAMPRRIRTRHALSQRLNTVRKLRNRVFHHESIITSSIPDLHARHKQILEVIAWISPAMGDTIALMDRFPATHASGILPYRSMIELYLGKRP